MTARRPYPSLEALLAAADEVWRKARPSDWRQAVGAHPRIGDKAVADPAGGQAARWSAEEQTKAGRSEAAARQALAQGNLEYERRFGRIYLVCAAGRSADELLADLRGRLDNSPEEELRVAAEEQHKITRRRLLKLLGTEET